MFGAWGKLAVGAQIQHCWRTRHLWDQQTSNASDRMLFPLIIPLWSPPTAGTHSAFLRKLPSAVWGTIASAAPRSLGKKQSLGPSLLGEQNESLINTLPRGCTWILNVETQGSKNSSCQTSANVRSLWKAHLNFAPHPHPLPPEFLIR